MHPYFGDVYDYRIALDIGAAEQKKRILCRNGKAMLQRFEEEWIPKENAYFEKYGIYEQCHLKIQVKSTKNAAKKREILLSEEETSAKIVVGLWSPNKIISHLRKTKQRSENSCLIRS